MSLRKTGEPNAPPFFSQHPVSYLAAWALLVALYAPNFIRLHRNVWRLLDYSHAPFVLPICFWLVWRRRAALSAVADAAGAEPRRLSLAVLAGGLALFLFGWRQEYLSVITASLIPVLFGLSGYLYGSRVWKYLAFPILYILFLVPPPMGLLDSATIPLRHLSSVGAEAILKLMQYPVARDGLLLSIGRTELFLGQPCSGFRSLITMLALGTVYADIGGLRRASKALLVAAIPPAALAGNIVRVVLLCLITVHFGKEAGEGFFHSFSGLVVFAVMMLALVGCDRLLRSAEARRA